jgi:integrase
VNAIRLLIMTGCRKGEVLSLRWQDVDFERSCFRLPDSKTGAKTVPVGAAVLKLVEGLPRVHGNEFVLPGSKDGRHFVGLPKVWRRVRERAGLSEVRLHDLRHSFASVGAAGGDSLYMIGKLLGHQQSSTTARYAHLADDPLKAAADRISYVIDTAMKGNIQGVELVELSGRKT